MPLPRLSSAGALALVLVIFASACDRPGASNENALPPVAFDTASIRIESGSDVIMLSVEVAETDPQRRQGLMERPMLEPDAGMVFLFDEQQDADAGFWMFRTRIPLDIAYFDADGVIVAILTMQPCDSPNPGVCRTYSPGVAYRGALELNRGWFGEHAVVVGDRIVIDR